MGIYLLGENPRSLLISSENGPNTLITSKEELLLAFAKATAKAFLFWPQFLLYI